MSHSTLVIPRSKSALRYEAHMLAQGYYAETFDRRASTAAAIVSGTTYLSSIGLSQGDPVSEILLMCFAAGSGYSGIGMKVGVTTKAGVRLGISADVSALMTGAPLPVRCPLLVPFNIPSTDDYDLAVLAIASTPPTLHRGATSTAGGAFVGASHAAWSRATGQTDITDPVVGIAGTTGQALWLAVNG